MSSVPLCHGCSGTDAKVVERKDGTTTENMNIQVHDDTAEATLGLWGTLCHSPSGSSHTQEDAVTSTQKSPNPLQLFSFRTIRHITRIRFLDQARLRLRLVVSREPVTQCALRDQIQRQLFLNDARGL